MSTPIYANGNEFDPLMRLLMFKQQMDMQKENQKLRQQELKLKQQEAEAEAAQRAQQQMPALLNFIQAAQDPSMGQLTQMPLELLGNAQVSTPTVMGAINAVAAPQQMGGRVLPPKIDQRLMEMARDAQTKSFFKQVEEILSPEDFQTYRAAWEGVVLAGGDPSELAKGLHETAIQRIERMRAEEELKKIGSERDADIGATAVLKKQGHLPASMPDYVPGAFGMLRAMREQDRQDARAERQIREQRNLAEAEGIAMELAVSGVPHNERRTVLKSQFGLGEGEAARISIVADEAVRKATGAPGEMRGRAQINLPMMEAGHRVLAKLAEQGVEAPSAWDAAMDRVPIVGNYLIDRKTQQLLNASRAFADAILRIETGAQQSQSEIRAVAKRFSPLAGDGPEVKEQKRAMREQILDATRRASGQPWRPGILPPHVSRMIQEAREEAAREGK